MQSKITIGITGGIGSGKSTICRIINAMAYPVFYSDQEAKKLLRNDLSAKTEIISTFGEEAYKDNELNHRFLSQAIFKDDSLRNRINEIVHPRIRQKFKDWTHSQSSDLVFNEAAILFETGSYKNFDYTILVHSPKELRINRLIKRDSVSREEVEQKISKQWSDERKIKLADHSILNNEEELIIPQVIKILNKIRENEGLKISHS